jgi:hypothetical protein
LLGDGSPRRIARARVLVETLKKLPELEDEGSLQGVVAAAGPPTLESLEHARRRAGTDRSSETSNLPVTSTSFRPMFGRIVFSRRVRDGRCRNREKIS